MPDPDTTSDDDLPDERTQWNCLPEDTTETCDAVTDASDGRIIGWNWSPGDLSRCGAKAVAICPSTCTCGKCDMTIRHCAVHQIAHLATKAEERSRHVEFLRTHEKIETALPGGGRMVEYRKRRTPTSKATRSATRN